jgi:hypothetical protein
MPISTTIITSSNRSAVSPNEIISETTIPAAFVV